MIVKYYHNIVVLLLSIYHNDKDFPFLAKKENKVEDKKQLKKVKELKVLDAKAAQNLCEFQKKYNFYVLTKN